MLSHSNNAAAQQQGGKQIKVTLRGQTIRIPPLIGGYELLLIIDNREKKSRIKPTEFSDKLKRLGIAVIMKALPLGDALWVARPPNSDDESKWIILGFIMERKALNDLVDSIKDGRLVEQRTRLAASGLRNVTYIIEGKAATTTTTCQDDGSSTLGGGGGGCGHALERLGLQESTLATTLTKLDSAFGFHIHQTGDIQDTLWVLGCMTRAIAERLNSALKSDDTTQRIDDTERAAEYRLRQILLGELGAVVVISIQNNYKSKTDRMMLLPFDVIHNHDDNNKMETEEVSN